MALSIGWIWILGMQFWEYFIWKYPEDLVYVQWAYIFNVTQIIILALIFLTFFIQPTINRIVAFVLLLVYILYILQNNYTLKQLNRDNHLEYSWWDNYGGYVYMIFLIAMFCLLVRPFYWSMATLVSILILFIFSWFFYKRAVASMWCFFAVSVPLISFLISCEIYDRE